MSEADIQNQPEGGAEGGAEPGVDMSAINDRFDQLAGELTGLREQVAPAEQYQEPDPGFAGDPYQQQYGYQPPPQYGQPQGPYGYNVPPPMAQQQVAQQFHLDPANVYDDYGNVNPVAAQQYQQVLQQAVVRPEIQQAVQPLMQELREMRLDRGAEQLTQKYPEYNDREAADGLVREVRDWAVRAGLDPQEAVENDAILEQHILVKRAQQAASQERPAAGEQTHELEAGQGAGPGGAPASFSDQVNDLRSQMAPGASRESLDFWGAGSGI